MAYEAIISGQQVHDSSAQSQITLHDRFKVYLGVAISALYSSQTFRIIVFTEQLLEGAISSIQDIFRGSSSLDAVDCMLYLIVYSTLSMPTESTWHLIALTMRFAITTGLHKAL
jgi:hypothetical protein